MPSTPIKPTDVGSAASSLHSVFLEKMTEQLLVAELLQERWYGLGRKVGVLRTAVDDAGYDVVLECGGILRHVQLKSSRADSTTARQTINIALADKPSGCVVWVIREENFETRRMSLRYRFFGGSPGEPLPAIPATRRRKAKRRQQERPNMRTINKGQFQCVHTTQHLLELLFGPLGPADG